MCSIQPPEMIADTFARPRRPCLLVIRLLTGEIPLDFSYPPGTSRGCAPADRSDCASALCSSCRTTKLKQGIQVDDLYVRENPHGGGAFGRPQQRSPLPKGSCRTVGAAQTQGWEIGKVRGSLRRLAGLVC